MPSGTAASYENIPHKENIQKGPGRSEFHSRPGPLRPFGAQWRRQKHHDEYHHRESGRYQRKGTVER